MTALTNLVHLSFSLHLCLLHVSCIASGLVLLEDEQNFKLGGCLGTHKMMISCANMSSKCRK
jgi:hypothetical protein